MMSVVAPIPSRYLGRNRSHNFSPVSINIVRQKRDTTLLFKPRNSVNRRMVGLENMVIKLQRDFGESWNTVHSKNSFSISKTRAAF